MKQKIALIGVPSSAGAHWPGQEKAPGYLREAGLVAQLESIGLEVVDYGDLPPVRFQPDKEHRHQQNLGQVVGVCQRLADQVDLALQQDAVPLVVGGDCTISLGVIVGFLRRVENLSLLYFDGHVDLNTLASSPSGIFDSMSIAHMLGESGTAAELSHIGARYPLMPEDQIVLFGYNPDELNTTEGEALARHRMQAYPLAEVQGRAAQAVAEALKSLEGRGKKFLLHFDVDVIDFMDFPVADVPQFNQGLTFREALACLAVFAVSPAFGGLVITEFNPDHADEEGALAQTFVESLARALVGKETDRG
jgi:arginase